MAEKLNPVDAKILELLQTSRNAVQQSIVDKAQAAFEDDRFEAEQETLEGYVGSMMLDLKGRMLQDNSRIQSHHHRRLKVDARKLTAQHPQILNPKIAKQILEKRQKPGPAIQTGPIFPLEAEGMPGEQVSQCWYLSLNIRPVPPGVLATMNSYLRLQVETEEEGEPFLVHEMHLHERPTGLREMRVVEEGRHLQSDELFVPLGLILEARELYPPVKNPR